MRTDQESTPVPKFSYVLILSPTFLAHPKMSSPKLPSTHKIHHWAQQTPLPSPGWIDCRLGHITGHLVTTPDLFPLAPMKKSLRRLWTISGSTCLFIQR